MIIVSQDKEKIVNFDNLTQVYITQDEEETAYFIKCETVDSLYDDLGKYETEERAKEVLKEITRQYENSMWKLGKTTSSFQDEFVYRMPED